jgi:hypothetical protein
VKRFAACSTLFVLVLAAGCASTTPVDMTVPRRVVGTESHVRIDAEVYGDKISPNDVISLKYDITNSRSTTILVADLIPQTTYDIDTQVVTIDIGTEVPGNQFLPRLIAIQPGEKKSFSTSARMTFVLPRVGNTPVMRVPNALRVRVNFLSDPKPFEQLIAIPERAVHNPQLADKLFTPWLERNETVLTNALPMHWGADANPFTMERVAQPPVRRGRG